MIPALTIILLFQLIGEVTSRALGLPLPGPVLGLVLLVVCCWVRPALSGMLRPAATGLLGHLSLFFVPAGVGVIAHMPTLQEFGLPLAATLILSTVAAIAAGAWAFTIVARLLGTAEDDRA